MGKEKLIAIGVLVLFAGIVAYFFISSSTAKGEIPPYVTGEKREIYEWARTAEGAALLEQMPCYCGCKYEGHKHTRNCFWTNESGFNKHGNTCSVCFDIAIKTKQRHEEGVSICEIRKEIDKFYEPNKHLGTDTPMPAGCE